MKKIRVAVCITRFEPGGQSVVIEEQTKRLANEFEFVLFTERLVQPCPPWMKCIIARPWLHHYAPLVRKDIVETLKKFNIIHCHDSIPFIDAALKSGRTVIVTSHGFPPIRLKPSLRGKMHTLLAKVSYPKYYNKVSKVIAISKYIMNWLIQDLKVTRHRVVLIYNGIDHELFRPLPKDTWIHYRFGDPTILYVGYIGKIKKTHIAIHAVKKIARDFPRVKLVLVGHGDEKYKESLLKLAKKLGLENNIKLVGFVPKHQLPLFYNAADVLAVTSPWEGFGLPIIEAFACGTPVVARGVYAMREHIEESRVGALYMRDEELADSILKVLSEGKEKYKYKALEYAEKFDWNKNVKMLHTIYEQVLEG